MGVEFGLLGEVTARVDGRAVDLGPVRQRCVLAALAVDVGRVVSVDRLVERVWAPAVPRRGAATLHSYVSRLRRVLAVADTVDIVHRSGGYALVVDQPEPAVDLHRFRDLCARSGADDVALLTEALGLWRGEPLTGLTGEWAEAERVRLRQEQLSAEHDLVDARLRAGEGGELVVELSARTARYPSDERVAGQYLLALHRAGRSADALEHYERLRERLAEQLGTDPGAPLRELHRRIVAADPALSGPTPSDPTWPGPPGGRAAEPVAVPRQLPAAPQHFTGRDRELAALTTALDDAAAGRTVVISAIAGTGGIGKTWLALHWAHRHADRFPDGQLFVDLRGFSPDSAPMDPAVVVRGFLHALGVEPARLPVDAHAQTALFRSLVADKRVLIVADNAADAGQVGPLLPGGASCTVLVTSRSRLAGLTAGHGAHHVPLDVLSDDEARALLSARLGAGRVRAEPAAVAELIRLCGGFPLALGIVAARAHTRLDQPMATLAEELRDLGLGALDDDDPTASLPAVLSWSYRALPPDQATAFALLGMATGPDIDLPAVAGLTGLSPRETMTVLRGLEQASLLTRDNRGRYHMHDLIRSYATTTARRELTEQAREAGLRRLLDFYTHTAYAAARLLHPDRPPIRLDPPVPGVRPHPLPDVPAAMAWFDAEYPNLLAAQHTATTHHWHHAVWQLAWTLGTFYQRRGHLYDQLAGWRTGLAAAAHLPDPATRVVAHRHLGLAYTNLRRHEEAIGHLREAIALAEHHQDLLQQAETHRVLAGAFELSGDDRKALDHSIRALDLFRALARPVGEADALNDVGWYAARMGEYETAREHCEAALALYHRHQDPAGEAASLDSLGYIAHHTGHHAEAIRHYQQALALYRRHDNTYFAADALADLGHPHAALGRPEEARAVWREALELYRAQGRDADVERVQRQLDALDGQGDSGATD
ncbi:DNA-binding SARP family transcriptional activator/tetratricopeptide (TPR) repeat protein [Saccharothrix tamanrassetensis]|uniref:DNA-binding SARP family transcriptional activator/tetratricopeptide (TPR) repeat protein n=1 Tax=Saccharothrix tamanrassetensis TaxID=1051531 RepID=A0A841C5Q7_9PSEU|nr:BTAD domain-containing putative transcriptional regulator [Saccharothrix tamanrassetensis]MBB5953872.1 DNA-binding SARP family transcriptional activator/tetratricopeptide (TPR) repeat protein [Saccharothrix tamanrassetensis]